MFGVLFRLLLVYFGLFNDSGYVTSLSSESIQLYNRAILTQAEDINQALALYQAALSIDFAFPEAHQNIALLYDRLGDVDRAHQHNVHSIETSASADFVSYALLNLLQVEMRMLHRFPHTYEQYLRWIDYCNKAVELSDHKNAEAYFHLALLKREIGHLKESLEHFQFILEHINRDDVKAWLNIGNHFFFADDFPRASEHYLQALQRVLKKLNTTQSDGENRVQMRRRMYDQDLAVSILNNVAQSFREIGRHSRALYYFQLALELLDETSETVAIVELSHNYNASGKESERDRASERQRERRIMPSLAVALHSPLSVHTFSHTKMWLLLSIYTIKGMLNDWRDWEEVETMLSRYFSFYRDIERRKANDAATARIFAETQQLRPSETAIDPYTASLMSFSQWEQDLWICALACKAHTLAASAPFDRDFSLLRGRATNTDRSEGVEKVGEEAEEDEEVFRVAYISYDWRDHPMGRLTAAIATAPPLSFSLPSSSAHMHSQPHRQRRIRREVHCLSYGKNDRSAVRRFVSKYCTVFHDAFAEKNDFSLAEYIAQLNIHVLVDITGHTYNGRGIAVSLLRPAPVTINYLGYPGVAACAGETDYTTVDAHVLPAELVAPVQRDFLRRERLIVLPFCYQANALPLSTRFLRGYEREEERERLVIKYTPTEISLTRTQTITQRMHKPIAHMCIFNANKKFEPLSFSLFTNVLRRVGASVVWLLDFSEDSQREILAQFAVQGVARTRVFFLSRVSWEEHLARAQALCDLSLDTFVYGAHTTATDLLYSAVPIFALRAFGERAGKMPSRVAATIVDNLDSLHGEKETELPNDDNTHSDTRNKGYRFRDLLTHDSAQSVEDTVVALLRDLLKKKAQGAEQERESALSRLQRDLLSASCIAPSFAKYAMRSQLDVAHAAAFDAKKFLREREENKEDERALHLILSQDDFRSRMQREKTFCEIEREILEKDLAFDENEDDNGMNKNFSNDNRSDSDSNSNSSPELSRFSAAVLSWNYMNAPSFQGRERAIVPHEDVLFPRNSVNIEEVRSALRARLGPYRTQSTRENTVLTQPHFPNSDATHSAHLSGDEGAHESEMDREFFRWENELRSNLRRGLSRLFAEQDRIERERSNENSDEVQMHAFSVLFFRLLFEHVPLITQNAESQLGQSESRSLVLCVSHPLNWMQRFFAGIDDTNPVFSHTENVFSLANDVLLPCLAWHSHYLTPSFTSDVRWSVNSNRFSHDLREEWRQRLQSDFSETDREHMVKGIARIVNAHALLHHQIFTAQSDIEGENENTMSLEDFISFLSLNSPCHRTLRCVSAWEGLSRIIAAQRLDPRTDRLQDVGTYAARLPVSLTQSLAFCASSLSVIQRQREIVREVREKTNEHNVVYPILNTSSSRRRMIAIYCYEYGQSWWPLWGPQSFSSPISSSASASSAGQAVGGSEEAVAHLSVELARLGFDVHIFGDIFLELRDTLFFRGDVDAGEGEVRWFHIADLLGLQCFSYCFDVFIAWRYALSLSLGVGVARRRVLWLHDLVPTSSLPPLPLVTRYSSHAHSETGSQATLCDLIWVQSPFHKKHVIKEYLSVSVLPWESETQHQGRLKLLEERVVHVLPNGFPRDALFGEELDGETETRNNNDVFVFGSAPQRGLQEVLELWPYIRRHRPQAVLRIYYGFTPAAVAALRKQFTDESQFLQWVRYMETLLQQEGVDYRGAVDHDTLQRAYAEAGFLLYPTSFPETGCITMVRAMTSGTIPITSRFADSVLATLGEEFDLGPSPLDALTARDFARKRQWLQSEYLTSVLAALDRDPHELSALRKKMKQHMRAKHTWQNSARIAVQSFGGKNF